jgi:hypothetical protein
MMETKEVASPPPPEVPLYSVPSIALASFLGGPLAAGWLISVNFRRMGEPQSARNALVLGAVATVALIGMMIALPTDWGEKVPGMTVPLIYTGLIWVLAERLQGRVLAAHFAGGGLRHSLWRSIGISLVAALPVAVLLLAMMALVPLPAPFDFEGDPIAVGEAGDLIYPSAEIPAEVTREIGRVLIEEGVFSAERPDVAGLRIEGDTYLLEIPVPLSSWSDLGILSGLRRARERLNEELSHRPVEIVLVHKGVSGTQRRVLGDE